MTTAPASRRTGRGRLHAGRPRHFDCCSPRGGFLLVQDRCPPWASWPSPVPHSSSPGASCRSCPWPVPAQYLFTDSPDPSSFSVGLLMLIVVLVALPLVLRHPLPPVALLAIAAPATNTGVHIVLRKLGSAAYPDVGVGALMIIVGGFLVTAEALRSTWLSRRDAFR